MGVVVEVGVVVVRWQWRWRPIHLSSSSLRLSHSSSCTSKMRDESDAIASGSSADTSTSRCGSRIGRSSEASKASGSSWGRGGAGVRRRCRESRRAGVAVVEAHFRSVGGTQSHRSAPRRRRAAACAVERNGARLAQRPSHHLRRRAGGGEPSKWQSGGDAAAALAPAALASSVARTGARPEGRPSGRIGTSLVLRRCAKCGKDVRLFYHHAQAATCRQVASFSAFFFSVVYSPNTPTGRAQRPKKARVCSNYSTFLKIFPRARHGSNSPAYA